MPVGRLAVALLLFLAAPAVAAAQGYSPEPLARSFLPPEEELRTERTRFLDWLREQRLGELAHEQLQPLREHLYLLIGATLRQQHEVTGQIYPVRDTTLFRALFSAARTLGVVGAAHVERALASAPAASPDPASPPGFRLRFLGPDLEIASVAGGLKTEILVVATLTAAHRGGPGQSQATIVVVQSPTSDVSAFQNFWLRHFGMGPSERVADTLLAGAETYRQYEPARHMHKEGVVFERGGRAFLILYSGLPGTFQSNYEHFRSLLRQFAY